MWPLSLNVETTETSFYQTEIYDDKCDKGFETA